jgi:hypothetical protein
VKGVRKGGDLWEEELLYLWFLGIEKKRDCIMSLGLCVVMLYFLRKGIVPTVLVVGVV